MTGSYLIVVNKPLSQLEVEEFENLPGKVLYVPEEKNIAELVRENYNGEDFIVGIGGDGTHGKIAQACLEQSVGGIFIPRGSGNDFSESLSTADFGQYVDALKTGEFESKKSDLLDVTVRRGNGQESEDYVAAVGAFVGLFADASKTDRFQTWMKKKSPRTAYIIRGIRDLFGADSHNIYLSVGGEEYSIDDVWAGWMTNTPRCGGESIVFDDVDMHDGLTDPIFLQGYSGPKPLTKLKLVKDIGKLKGQAEKIPFYYRPHEGECGPTRPGSCHSFYLRSETPISFGIDGEFYGDIVDMSGHVLPEAIDAYIPVGTSA